MITTEVYERKELDAVSAIDHWQLRSIDSLCILKIEDVQRNTLFINDAGSHFNVSQSLNGKLSAYTLHEMKQPSHHYDALNGEWIVESTATGFSKKDNPVEIHTGTTDNKRWLQESDIYSLGIGSFRTGCFNSFRK